MDRNITASEFVHKETENGVTRGIALMTMDDGTFLIGTSKQFSGKKQKAGKNKGKKQSGIMNGMLVGEPGKDGNWKFIKECGEAIVEFSETLRKGKVSKGASDESVLDGLSEAQLKKLLKALKNL